MASQLQALLQSSSDKHSVLQNLRDSGDPQHLFFQTLVELTLKSNGRSDSDVQEYVELLFHCALGMRHVVLLKWDVLDEGFKCEARDFLLELGLGCANERRLVLPKAVSNACLAAATVFWKRCWSHQWNNNHAALPLAFDLNQFELHPSTQARSIRDASHLFQYLELILLKPENNESVNSLCMTPSEACCMFLSTLVGEFNGSSTTGINLGLSLEYHSDRHRLFEKSGWLENCLRVAMKALGDTVVGPLLGMVSTTSTSIPNSLSRRTNAVTGLTIDLLSWDFGGSKAFSSEYLSKQQTVSLNLIKPPIEWQDYLIRPDFVGAMFNVYVFIRTCFAFNDQLYALLHNIRQLLLMLASINGEEIFGSQERQVSYAGFMLEGCLNILSNARQNSSFIESEIVDMCAMINRISVNFRLKILISLPQSNFQSFLDAVTSIACELLQQNLKECQNAKGDPEMMDEFEWQEEGFNYILDSVVFMTEEVMSMVYRGDSEANKLISIFSTALAPLYSEYILNRIQKSCLEEMYYVSNAAELDEIREDIFAAGLEEQMISAASLGRLTLGKSLSCINAKLQSCLPQLISLFQCSDVGDEISTDAAALLEEVRLIIVSALHLLTDDSSGETPLVPQSVIMSCFADETVCNELAGLISSFMTLAEQQASGIALKPDDPRLSPLIGQTLLSFLAQWAPAYIYPLFENYDSEFCRKGILLTWRQSEQVSHALDFCLTLCLHYFCFWPQEHSVQEGSTSLLVSLSKRKELRKTIVQLPSFDKLVALHVIATPVTHISSLPSMDSSILSEAHVKGYCRLPYSSRAHVLSALLQSSCEMDDKSNAIFQRCIDILGHNFFSFIDGLQNNKISIKSQLSGEMANLIIEQYRGAVATSEITNSERISSFVSGSLPYLAGLMNYYSDDLSICEGLLRLFRDYSEQFIFSLNDQECVVLFEASAELLKSYSVTHCSDRVVKSSLDEEQDYNDVLCAIQLLIHLSSKDFLDISNTVGSDQVTQIVFFGLQQILPLMTQGLLQFPTLCTQFFYLISSMVDSYVDKVCDLPIDLFQSLLDAILYGMTHDDVFVAKSSLRALSSITKEQIRMRSLYKGDGLHQDLFNKCSLMILQDVIFQPAIWDRLDPAGNALLPLIAIDINAFASIVGHICSLLNDDKRTRLEGSFHKLVKPEVVEKVMENGREGRMNRMMFKKDFEAFVKDTVRLLYDPKFILAT